MSSLQERNQVKLRRALPTLFSRCLKHRRFGTDSEFVEGNSFPEKEMLEELKGLVTVKHSRKSSYFNVPSSQVFGSLR